MSVTKPLVFVVDDEQIIATTLATILEVSGFRSRAFFDPFDALRESALEAPDMLITDVVMPQMTGTDLAIRMKAECPNCKILLFSGQASTADLLEKARAQGHDFTLLTKPIHPTDLLRRIRDSARRDN